MNISRSEKGYLYLFKKYALVKERSQSVPLIEHLGINFPHVSSDQAFVVLTSANLESNVNHIHNLVDEAIEYCVTV